MEAEVITGAEGFFRPKETLTIPPAAPDARVDGHAGLIADFIDCVRTGRQPETICTDNIKSLAMVFGAIESAETGKRVDIHW
jgi:predicted dehydrogenase